MRGAPKKKRLIPDKWYILHVGKIADGMLFFIDSQLYPDKSGTRDFVCSFLFDSDGHNVAHRIDEMGYRGTYSDDAVRQAFKKHLALLGPYQISDIWIRPFTIRKDGISFGFIPRKPESAGDDWRVEFMPGNTMSFYPPWEAGAYDT